MGYKLQLHSRCRRKIRKRVIERDGMVCWLCGLPVENLSELTMDHVKPVKNGGRYTVENLRVAHYGCNQARGYRECAS